MRTHAARGEGLKAPTKLKEPLPDTCCVSQRTWLPRATPKSKQGSQQQRNQSHRFMNLYKQTTVMPATSVFRACASNTQHLTPVNAHGLS